MFCASRDVISRFHVNPAVCILSIVMKPTCNINCTRSPSHVNVMNPCTLQIYYCTAYNLFLSLFVSLSLSFSHSTNIKFICNFGIYYIKLRFCLIKKKKKKKTYSNTRFAHHNAINFRDIKFIT